MADNAALPASGINAATDEVTYSGDTAHVTLVRQVHVAGAEGSRTVASVSDANGVFTQGPAAVDAAVAGNPLLSGARASVGAHPTAVANGDVAVLMTDKVGRLVTVHGAPRSLLVTAPAVTLTNTTETTLLAAGGAGVFHDLAFLLITNTANQPLRLDVRDVTAGTVQFSVYLAASGGGAVLPVQVNWPQTTANSAWTITLSASATDVRVSGVFIKNS